jgi:PKD repeat protein
MRIPRYIIVCLAIFLESSCEKDSLYKETGEVYARFICDPSVVLKGESIQFINTSENATSFFWDFGDGEYSTEEDPEHLYKETGEFLVSLSATSDKDSFLY